MPPDKELIVEPTEDTVVRPSNETNCQVSRRAFVSTAAIAGELARCRPNARRVAEWSTRGLRE